MGGDPAGHRGGGRGHAPRGVARRSGAVERREQQRREARGVAGDAVGAGQVIGAKGPVATASTPHPVGPGARDVARGVADHDRPLAGPRRRGPARAAAARSPGSAARSSASEPKPPWPGAKCRPIPARCELEARDRLVVAGDERRARTSSRQRQPVQQLGDPRQHRRARGRPGRAARRPRTAASRTSSARGVDPLGRDPAEQQHVARDLAVGAPGGLDPADVGASMPWTSCSASWMRRGVLGARPLQQRAVDVEEQQQRAGAARRSRRRLSARTIPPARAAARRRRSASRSASTSASWTISTGECM